MKQKAFTLIELLVVVVIVGIMATITVVSFTSYKERAQEASVNAELGQVKRLLAHLESDTSLSPGGIEIRPCIVDTAVQIQDCAAGITCNDGRFNADWKGPYGQSGDFIDPWENDYWFDASYDCSAGVNAPSSCGNFLGSNVRALVSAGPDGLPQTAANLPAGRDDTIMVICQS